MSYSYSASDGDFSSRRKQAIIVIAAALLITIFYFVNGTITTYATYSKNLQNDLESAKIALNEQQQKYDECQGSLIGASLDLSVCNSALNSTGSSLSSCNSEKSQLNSQVSQLNSQISSLNYNISSCQTNAENVYKQLARNSAKPICCSFGDFQSGASRSWSLANNSITCSGTYTVNCTSGETNY